MGDDVDPGGSFDQFTDAEAELAAASAALDGEGPPPTASPAVEQFRRDALRIRQIARSGDLPSMPDFSGVVAGLPTLPESGRRRSTGRPWRTLGAVAASFVIGVGVAAAFLLDDGFTTEPLAASEFEAELRGSLAAVGALDATVTVHEFGIHPQLVERTYEGTLHYRSPEQLSLVLTETTSLPDGWLPNDVTVVVDDGVAWRTRRLACPVESLPGCLAAPAVDGIDGRAPFSAGWAAPVELVVPVDSTRGASIARTDDSTVTAVTTVARASSLISTTIDNGAFRQVHADDTIEIRVDADALTLRGITIRAADSAARRAWATTWGYADEPGSELVRIDLTPTDDPGSLPARPAAAFSDGGFVDGPVAIDGLAEAMPTGFSHHRSGVLRVRGVVDTEISGWADGRAWITVRAAPSNTTDAPAGASTRTFDTGVVVVNGALHEALILTGDRRIVVSGTLPLDDLVGLASRLPYTGIAPTSPSGLATPPPIQVDGATIVVELRPGSRLPPADRGDIVGVALRGTTGRYSPTVGELTWVENDTIVVLSGSSDLGELLVAASQVVIR